MASVAQQQKTELHQAQYAAYNGMAVYTPPPPSTASPPPHGQQPTAPQGEQQNTAEAYAAYWAQYSYDVNSPQF
ncbi:hypothetical protein E1B28_007803 [Marasmius oreades]|uniref:Uncharacterized protein n=1 Tax=Marasmius oreades TaxID=181124 RepID=A0A9P7S2D6_9AGAR|nr:uncharacterized protein E1B28_007803 [Marasmius oreades]KAG7094196.1 hypothetical protein E1B28_007803 [Marasmius oreades]